MTTKRRLRFDRYLRRLGNNRIKFFGRVLNALLKPQMSKIQSLALASDWDGIDDICEKLLPRFRWAIATIYTQSLDSASKLLGAKISKAEEEWLTELGMGAEELNPRTISYIEQHGLELSQTVAGGLKSSCRGAITEGLKQGEGTVKIRRRLARELDNFSKVRLDMIARSETIRACNQGALEGYIESGIVGQKQWVASADERTCEECEALDGVVVEINEDFPGGYDCPPCHPDCRCTVVPVI